MHSLTDVLYELQDAIASFIDHPKDLLSLALTCRSLYRMIIRDHLQFRHVRCNWTKLSVWKALLSRPRLTARLRSLVLAQTSSGASDLIPWRMVEDDDDDDYCDGYGYGARHLKACTAALVTILHNTPSLRRLAWHDMHIEHDETLQMKNFFIGIRDHCHSLQELHLFCKAKFSLIACIEVIGNPIHVFSNLTQFSITLRITVFEEERIPPFISALADILVHGMPALRDLHIDGWSQTFPRLLERAQWPFLQRFYMLFNFVSEGTSDTEMVTVLSRFLEKHPQIECFYSHTPLLPGSIPVTSAFRSFKADHSRFASPRALFPPRVLSHIHSLEISEGLCSEWISMIGDMPCLRYLFSIHAHDVAQVVQLAPELERLGVLLWDMKPDSEKAKSAIKNLTFSRLTHLLLMTDCRHNSLYAPEVVLSMRSLQYISVEYGLWFLIERENRRRYVRCIELKGLAKWDDPGYNWGGYYLGIPECRVYLDMI
ncbi:hypothetical protein BU17DRAFT_65671 [Hysterangium stoloniferum]|nr:hypothetical protein BU17DRAFT_65671 [Hysterangium stoloniferum]